MSPAYPAPTCTSTPQQTYYEILSLTPSTLDSSPNPSRALKRAYHRALLLHHPDKRKPATTPTTISLSSSTSSSSSATITIDLLTKAYTTLSTPSLRAKYDTLLLTNNSLPPSKDSRLGGDNAAFQTGIENVDLDDLDFDEEKEEWFRGCRCGNERGYRFAEADLEEAGELGEVMVGCADCSLWLRVGFAVVEDGDGEERTEEEEGNGDGDGEEGEDGTGRIVGEKGEDGTGNREGR